MVKLAIDGFGDLAQRTILPHLSQPDAQEWLKVVAIADPSPQARTQAKEEFGILGIFENLETLLAQSDAEAVLITVPAALHFDHARLAIESGRHVYVQKPLAGSVAESDVLVEAATRQKIAAVAAPGQALWPLFPTLRTLIESGAIGQPYHAVGPYIGWAGHTVGHPTDPTWCFAKGSGPLRDHGVYSIQTLTTLLGPVAQVAALSRTLTPTRLWKGTTIPVTEDDISALLLSFQSGATGQLAEGWTVADDCATGFRIHGLEGVIEGKTRFVGYHSIFPLEAVLHRLGREPQTFAVEIDTIPFLAGAHSQLPNPHIWADISHLGECIQTGRPPLAGLTQARHTVDILESAFAAARTGQTQPLTTEFTLCY